MSKDVEKEKLGSASLIPSFSMNMMLHFIYYILWKQKHTSLVHSAYSLSLGDYYHTVCALTLMVCLLKLKTLIRNETLSSVCTNVLWQNLIRVMQE